MRGAWVLALNLASALLVSDAALAQRVYHNVPLMDVWTTTHTHVCTTGTVSLSKTEGDGDRHLRLEDGAGHFIVAEIIPALPVTPIPRVGQTVTVCGITRWDSKHKWAEIHPVEEIRVPEGERSQ